jgi:RNA polymerase sigma factor (sigma-70 family)
VEASAIHAPSGLGRITAHGPLLRLRTDDQLVALFRMGYDDAFRTIHDRYRQRLFAYTRQMLGGSRSDAEDVLQDVFLRAYGALRDDGRPVTLRAWLYRVAHNRCIDHLRRPVPPAAEVYQLARTPLHDPLDVTERREDLRRLVQDVQRLPEQQRSALLMRELDGLSYSELADALRTTVPAVKSLLVRARMGLVEAGEARDTACAEIRADIAHAHDRGVRASGRSRRHIRDCDGCRAYRRSLRTAQRALGALSPGTSGPWATLAKLLGLGGASSGAAASAGAGGSAVVVGGATAATATKVVAIVCCAAVVGGGAMEVSTHSRSATRAHGTARPAAAAPAAVTRAQAARAIAPAVTTFDAVAHHRLISAGPHATKPASHRRSTLASTDKTADPAASGPGTVVSAPAPEEVQTGGAMAPAEDALPGDETTGTDGTPAAQAPSASAPAEANGGPATSTPSADPNAGAAASGAPAGAVPPAAQGQGGSPPAG